ncbi:uncharacterized protein At3g49140 [Lingula anatina]|uniref:Uncharacterized protein At3g49140 n=1 Tax=Lingula anatina TaxID=7574 RepID=A0A1S3ISP7_LINAN|nr:uncharacterized protein At3g49140 [Lingula anatina]|eukprot:XP_013400961.1 uncharacterized protein At3g49140 [Lingula anatina]
MNKLKWFAVLLGIMLLVEMFDESEGIFWHARRRRRHCSRRRRRRGHGTTHIHVHGDSNELEDGQETGEGASDELLQQLLRTEADNDDNDDDDEDEEEDDDE